VHLGSKHSQVAALLRFLKENESEYIYIVGDFIDGWELKRGWRWQGDYNTLVQKILRKDRKKTKVTLLYGNHDEFLENFKGMRFGNVRIQERAIHTGADGRRYLVLHGHQFDGLTRFNRMLEKAGSRLYDVILDINLYANRIGRRLGFGYWSLSQYLKMKAKSAVQYIGQYEEAMVHMAHKHKADGIICGHIHRAEIKDVRGVRYMNCGDWVESCSALVEGFDGSFKIVHCYENSFYSAGGREGAHDSGCVRETDVVPQWSSSGGSRRGQESTPELAGLFSRGV
jgi:UDP-2,3-diacylglucosamine pyrophosphatase LpxH